MPGSTETVTSDASARTKDFAAAWVMTVAVFGIFILPTALWRPLYETPEARIAQVAREMVQSKDWVVPTLGGEPRLIKPPLPYWFTAVSARVLDVSREGPTQRVMTRAVEIPPALFGALAVFIAIFFGSRVFGRQAGIMAGLVLCLSKMVLNFTWVGYCDMTLMCACTGMFCSAAWLLCAPAPGVLAALAFGLSLGLGILSKWYIPLIVIAPLMAEVALRRRFSARKTGLFILGFALAAGIAAPWFFLVEQHLPGALQTIRDGVTKSTEALAHIPDHRWLNYFEKLGDGVLPWSALLLFAWPLYFLKLRRAGFPSSATPEIAESEKTARAVFRFFVLAFVLGFLAFYSQNKQQGYYLLPLFPVLALASGYILSRLDSVGGIEEENVAWSQMAIGFVGALCIGSLPWWRLKQLENASVEATLLKDPAMMIILGAAFFLVHVYSARQFVNGRPLKAMLAISALTFAGTIACEVHWVSKAQNKPLYVEVDRLKSDLARLGSDIKVYGWGFSQPMLIFYLERPVKTLKNLTEEPEGETGENAPRRVLVAGRDDLARLKLNLNAPETGNTFQLVELPIDEDWPKRMKSVFKQDPANSQED